MKVSAQVIFFSMLLACLPGCYPADFEQERSTIAEIGPDSSAVTIEKDIPGLLPEDSALVEFDCILPIETMPAFPGGQEKLAAYLVHTLRMPREAKLKKITGTVYVQLMIDSTGNVEEAQVIKGIGYGCDEEALRVIKAMPAWKPGEQMGRPVQSVTASRLSLPCPTNPPFPMT
jgi:TonB family protein